MILCKQEREGDGEIVPQGFLLNRHYSDYRRAAPALLPDPVPTDFNSLSPWLFQLSTEDVVLLLGGFISSACLTSYHITVFPCKKSPWSQKTCCGAWRLLNWRVMKPLKPLKCIYCVSFSVCSTVSPLFTSCRTCNTATQLSPHHLSTSKWADLYRSRYMLAPFVATKTACVDARIHIPSCIDVWLHLQCSSAEEAQAATGTLIYEGQGRCDVSHCGYHEKEGQAYIPSGSHFLRTWLYLYEFVLSICLWAESLQPAMRMVWSHISVAGGLWDSVGIPRFPLLLLLIEKHNLLGLGCEKQEWKHFHIARW